MAFTRNPNTLRHLGAPLLVGVSVEISKVAITVLGAGCVFTQSLGTIH